MRKKFGNAELRERVAKLEEKQLQNVIIKNFLHASQVSRKTHDHINKTIFGYGYFFRQSLFRMMGLWGVSLLISKGYSE